MALRTPWRCRDSMVWRCALAAFPSPSPSPSNPSSSPLSVPVALSILVRGVGKGRRPSEGGDCAGKGQQPVRRRRRWEGAAATGGCRPREAKRDEVTQAATLGSGGLGKGVLCENNEICRGWWALFF
jgi:hypothetical protein